MTITTLPAQPAVDPRCLQFPDAAAKSQYNPQIGNTTEGMIDDLADSVAANGVHDDQADPFKAFGNTLEALIDIATFKLAPEMAYRAEQQLLALYADPAVSSSVNREMIKQLIETQDILAGNRGPKTEMFAMPASLLHLIGQSARNGIENQEVDCAIPPSRLEAIESTLIDATGVADERGEGRDILGSARFVTSDEVNANFAKIHRGYEQEINISDEITVEAMTQQFDGLLGVASEKGITVAPLFCNGHFMLVTAEKSNAANKCKLTIVNTHVALDEIGHKAVSALSTAERRDPIKCNEIDNASVDRYDRALVARMRNSFPGKSVDLTIHSQQLQGHAINSCGPLISLLAENIDANEEREVNQIVLKCFSMWRNLNARQQKDVVMAQRSKMIGDTVYAKMRSRFVDLSAP
ncbi:MAG TPA: hypothetical protein VGM52_05175 [Herbaspirillum sp.]|jgi:hypothetical protein